MRGHNKIVRLVALARSSGTCSSQLPAGGVLAWICLGGVPCCGGRCGGVAGRANVKLKQPWEAVLQIILYYAPFACSLVPYVALTEAGADFEVRTLNLRAQQQMTPEYLRINPKHKVPMLAVDGKSLTENVAIQSWIAGAFPAARLLPADRWQQLEAVSLMSWCASGIHPFLGRLNAPVKVCSAPGAEESVRALAVAPLLEAFGIADEKLAGREFFFDHFTAADVHFYWCLRRASQLQVDMSKFANCQRHLERMQSRPSVQKLLAFEKQTLDAFAKAG